MITLGSCSEVCLCTGWKCVDVCVHCRLVWEERLFGWCRVWLDGSHHEYTGELSPHLGCCILLPRMTVSRMQRLVIGCRPYLLLIWLELRTWQLSREHFQVQNPDVTSPSGRGRHQTGKDAGKGTPAWSESKPSGIDILGGTGRLTNAHPSVQVHRWEQCVMLVTVCDIGDISEDLLTWILVGTTREPLRIDPMLPSPPQMTQSRWDGW